MDNLLCLDTAGSRLMFAVGSVETLAFRYEQGPDDAGQVSQRYHSAILAPMIREGLQAAGMTIRDLAGLAVNIGPGSFTGIRTGIATIRILAQFLEIPVHAFTQFELLAAEYPGERVAVYLNALQNRAYHAVLTMREDGPVWEVSPRLLALDDETAYPAGCRYLVSAALSQCLKGRDAETLEEKPHFTPAIMAKLAASRPQCWLKPWQELLPLYLQQPNITLRRPQPGTLK